MAGGGSRRQVSAGDRIHAFVMKGVAPKGTTMMDIYKAGLPFLGCDSIVLLAMVVFPPLVLWLPRLMGAE